MRTALYTIWLLACIAAAASAGDEFEQPPISYSQATPDNAVSRLQAKLREGSIQLEFDPARGYLPALLKALNVPVESQTLVFSKTSMQRTRIAPKTPRALYFNDDVYVGYCQEGVVMEVSVADPTLGAVFYTVDQQALAKPALIRQTDNCLQCHSTNVNVQIPGHLLRSVFPDAAGLPLLAEGSHRVDQTTPLADRWGGWYVTGTHGDQKHLGNFIAKTRPLDRPIDNSKGQNVVDLSDRLATSNYLTGHSDIVALMVLEHQTFVHNLLTQANYVTRQALEYNAKMGKVLGEESGGLLESVSRRITNAGEKLLEGLLFADEARLTAPIAGGSGFAEVFTQAGPRDSQGRSLREFDLKTRIFKYPCSYLIYSEAFDRLPDEMRAYLRGRLQSILTDANHAKANEKFAHLTASDRRAILEILRDTKPKLFEPQK